tara:strand:- start:5359 stop:5580 length:222 start_codon:yes stop_codon:yes gene_type:complete
MKDIETSLEDRIAKAIKENTCPYTTDADIRYFETEEYRSYLGDLLTSATNENEVCICGEPLTGDHYEHMAKGF